MKLIHVQTQITTVLGWLDDDDNVAETVTLQGQPENLSDEAWVDVVRGLREKRAELVAEREGGQVAEGNGQPANREQRRAAAKRARPKAKR